MKDIQNATARMSEVYGLCADAMTRFADFVSEVGELGKELVRGTDYGASELVVNEKLAMEMGDVIFALALLANELGLDLDECFAMTKEKCRKRFEEHGSIGSQVEL